MPVPKQVREQAEQAEQLQSQLANRDTEEPAPEDENAEKARAEEGTNANSDQPQETPSNEGDGDEQHPKPPEPESAEAPSADDYKRLKSAHETLLGKYNSEVPRMAGEIRELKQSVSERDSRIQSLESQLQQAQDAPEKRVEADSDDPDEYDRKLRDELGDEFADAVEKKARMIARSEVDNAKAETQEDEIERFKGQLRRNIDKFDEINQSRDFIDWLQANYDPNTGFPYQDTLNQAGRDRDLNGVIRVFDQYSAAQKPEPARQEPQQPDPHDQEAPPRKGKPSGETAPDMGQQYTPQDYQKLQSEIAMGKWKGREAEARQLEAEIHAALTQ